MRARKLSEKFEIDRNVSGDSELLLGSRSREKIVVATFLSFLRFDSFSAGSEQILHLFRKRVFLLTFGDFEQWSLTKEMSILGSRRNADRNRGFFFRELGSKGHYVTDRVFLDSFQKQEMLSCSSHVHF